MVGSAWSSTFVSLYPGSRSVIACFKEFAWTIVALASCEFRSSVLSDVTTVPISDLAAKVILCASWSTTCSGNNDCVSVYVELRQLLSSTANIGFGCRLGDGKVFCVQLTFRLMIVLLSEDSYTTLQRPDASRWRTSSSSVRYWKRLARPRFKFADETLSSGSMYRAWTSPYRQTTKNAFSAISFILDECSTKPSGFGARRDLIHNCGDKSWKNIRLSYVSYHIGEFSQRKLETLWIIESKTMVRNMQVVDNVKEICPISRDSSHFVRLFSNRFSSKIFYHVKFTIDD